MLASSRIVETSNSATAPADNRASAIPANSPRNAAPVRDSYHRDGAMRISQGATPAINPNSYGRWDDQPQYREPALKIDPTADRFNHREDDEDYFSQPGVLFREKMTPEQQQALFENTARAISGASKETIERHIANCTKADPAYGQGVRAAVEALGRDDIETPGPNSDETDNPVTGKTEEQFVASGA